MNDGDDDGAAAPADSVTPDDDSAAATGAAVGAGASPELNDADADADADPKEAMNIFKLSVKEAFKTGLTPRAAKAKDAGGNHEKGGGKLWAGCMEVIAVVSTVAVVELYKLNAVDPQLESAWFQTLDPMK
jgi:hypothetical protein